MQRTGYGGTTQRVTDYSALGTGASEREFEVTFMADTAPDLHWSFTPSQPKLRVRAGEPVLAFYKATNNRDRPVTGGHAHPGRDRRDTCPNRSSASVRASSWPT